MTTVAYRDGVMAADSLVTGHGVRMGSLAKLVRAKDGTIGGAAGNTLDSARLLRWVGLMGADCRNADVPRSEDKDTSVLIAYPDGSVEWIGGHDGRVIVDAGFHAIGSGGEIAIGAMAFGATAEQAVEIACRLDVWSGGPVQVLNHG